MADLKRENIRQTVVDIIAQTIQDAQTPDVLAGTAAVVPDWVADNILALFDFKDEPSVTYTYDTNADAILVYEGTSRPYDRATNVILNEVTDRDED